MVLTKIEKGRRLLHVVFLILLWLSHFSYSLEQKGPLHNGRWSNLKSENKALGMFREMMRPFLKNTFMMTDSYLMRWLQTNDFNIQQARRMLLDNLRWRRENNIDMLLTEDFSDMHDEYPYSYASDKHGRPSVMQIGSWNLRRAAATGRIPRLMRYLTKMLEMNTYMVSQSKDRGRTPSDYKIIANLDGFNTLKQACPLCLPVYSSFLRTMQGRYPGYSDQFILVNTPPAMTPLVEAVQPFLTPRIRRAFKVFGRDRRQWTEYLESQDISKEEIDRVLGMKELKNTEPIGRQ